MNIGADGLTTGSTEESGFGLVGLGGPQRPAPDRRHQRRRERRRSGPRKRGSCSTGASRAFERVRLFDEGEVVAEARVFGGAETRVGLVSKGPLDLLLPLGSREQLKAEVVYDGPLPAPVEAGREVGVIKVTTGEGLTMQAPGLHRRRCRRRLACSSARSTASRSCCSAGGSGDARVYIRGHGRQVHHLRRRGGGREIDPDPPPRRAA